MPNVIGFMKEGVWVKTKIVLFGIMTLVIVTLDGTTWACLVVIATKATLFVYGRVDTRIERGGRLLL